MTGIITPEKMEELKQKAIDSLYNFEESRLESKNKSQKETYEHF